MGKINIKYADDHLEGKVEGMNAMKDMVLEVFNEHADFTKEEIKNYIEENL